MTLAGSRRPSTSWRPDCSTGCSLERLPLGLLDGQALAHAAAEQPLEQAAGVAARRLALGDFGVAAVVGVERGEDARAVARRAASAGQRHALALQRLEIALHALDLGIERRAHCGADRQQGEAAAGPARAAARRRQLVALRGDGAVVFLDLGRAAAARSRPTRARPRAAGRCGALAEAGAASKGDQRNGARGQCRGVPRHLPYSPHRVLRPDRPPVNSSDATLNPAKLTFALRYGRFAAGSRIGVQPTA